MWTHLERQSGAGGVGLRGPGEKQLEMDQRIIKDRIQVLQKKIDNVQKQRQLHRRKRKSNSLPILSLVGYTNAGNDNYDYDCIESIEILCTKFKNKTIRLSKYKCRKVYIIEFFD